MLNPIDTLVGYSESKTNITVGFPPAEEPRRPERVSPHKLYQTPTVSSTHANLDLSPFGRRRLGLPPAAAAAPQSVPGVYATGPRQCTRGISHEVFDHRALAGFHARIYTTMMNNRDFTSTNKVSRRSRLSFEVEPVNSEASSTDHYMFGASNGLGATATYTQAIMAHEDIEPVKHGAAHILS